MKKATSVVYLIHLDRPLAHARHYIGFTQRNFKKRYMDHLTGKGARMLEVCVQRGITFDVVRIWRGADRSFERKLKNRHGAADLCPICNAKFKNHGRA